jgi:hypothetical protein
MIAKTEIEIAIPALVATIKAHLAKGAQSKEKSAQHFLSAGLHLKELKARKPSETPWPEYVRETFGLGRERADELIRISDGTTTVEKTRAIKAASMRKTRAKSLPRGTGAPSEIADAAPATIDRVSEDDNRAHAVTSRQAAVLEQADRAQATSDAAKAKPGDPALGQLVNVVYQIERISIGEQISDTERIDVIDQVGEAVDLLNEIAIAVAISGGAKLGKLAPMTRLQPALEFLKTAVARIEAAMAPKGNAA